jgi:hypothetical protein
VEIRLKVVAMSAKPNVVSASMRESIYAEKFATSSYHVIILVGKFVMMETARNALKTVMCGNACMENVNINVETLADLASPHVNGSANTVETVCLCAVLHVLDSLAICDVRTHYRVVINALVFVGKYARTSDFVKYAETSKCLIFWPIWL